MIMADGFSCREQIAQETERHALHLAEVIQMAETNDACKLCISGSSFGETQRKASRRKLEARLGGTQHRAVAGVLLAKRLKQIK